MGRAFCSLLDLLLPLSPRPNPDRELALSILLEDLRAANLTPSRKPSPMAVSMAPVPGNQAFVEGRGDRDLAMEIRRLADGLQGKA